MPALKLVIAEMLHETNTFSPVPTDWARFERWGAHFGTQVERAFAEAAVPVAAYLRLAREAGAEYVTPVAAEAMPSGPVAAEAYERMYAPILEAVAAGCDAALLHLHGAMVTETTDDGEGTLLKGRAKAALAQRREAGGADHGVDAVQAFNPGAAPHFHAQALVFAPRSHRGGAHHPAVVPPSICHVAPVTKRASSEAR